MKPILSIAIFGLLVSSLAQAADPDGPRSISELATLSNVLVQRYDCTADLLLAPASNNREVKFSITPLTKGETGPNHMIQLQADKLIASATSQMLSLEWTRVGRVVATVRTMVTDSPQRNYVLIAIDPSNPEQQAQIVCNAITFAQAAPGTK